jgi:hypothetical protein
MTASQRTLRFAFALVAGLAAVGASRLDAATPSCSGTGVSRVTWGPWDFCVTRMTNTTPQPNGSGMEITQVHFKGRLILKRAGIPVLNVKYASGGCGCFRDWFDAEKAYTCTPINIFADGSAKTGFCSGTGSLNTVCDHPGTDAGSFTGISSTLEDGGKTLKLTQQSTAGWYRYIPVWKFSLDGSMRAGMNFTAVNDSCVASTHHHHAYWRMDFDVDGPTGDYVDYYYHDPASSSWGTATRVGTETSWIDSDGGGALPTAGRSHWRLGSVGSPVKVDVIRQQGDETANLSDTYDDGITGDFPTLDGVLLAYDASQMTDAASQQLGDCPLNMGSYDNDADVDDADVVLWVRSGVRHVGEDGGASHQCFSTGAKIKVTAPSTVVDLDGDSKSNVMLYSNGAWVEFTAPGS